MSLVLAARIKIDLCEEWTSPLSLHRTYLYNIFTLNAMDGRGGHISEKSWFMQWNRTPKITKEFIFFCDLLSVLSNSKQFVPKTMEVDPVHPFWIQNKEKHSLVQLIFWENLGCPYNTYIFNISHLRPTGPLQLPSLRAAISISRFERHEEWLRFSRVMICRAPCHHLTLPNMSGWGVSWGNLHGVRKNRWGALSLSTSNTKV